jgi:MtN3 and saliva related transmembrane protein
MAASPMLQALRVHRMQRSEDVSVAFLAVFFAGAVAWLSYGIALGNMAIIVANAVGVLASAATISVVLYWRRRERQAD